MEVWHEDSNAGQGHGGEKGIARMQFFAEKQWFQKDDEDREGRVGNERQGNTGCLHGEKKGCPVYGKQYAEDGKGEQVPRRHRSASAPPPCSDKKQRQGSENDSAKDDNDRLQSQEFAEQSGESKEQDGGMDS